MAIYQVEFINDHEPNNIESVIKFYVTDDLSKLLESVASDMNLESFVVSSINNISYSNPVYIL
jgi:hypothetical protein